MAAVALAISGGGALSSLETTVLLTVDETMGALRMAEQVGYQVPGAYRARTLPSPATAEGLAQESLARNRTPLWASIRECSLR